LAGSPGEEPGRATLPRIRNGPRMAAPRQASGDQLSRFARVRGIAPEFATGRSALVRRQRTTSPASGDGVVQRCRLPIGAAGGVFVAELDHQRYCLWCRAGEPGQATLACIRSGPRLTAKARLRRPALSLCASLGYCAGIRHWSLRPGSTSEDHLSGERGPRSPALSSADRCRWRGLRGWAGPSALLFMVSRRRAGTSDAGLYQERFASGGQGKAQAASSIALREFAVLRRNSPLVARPWSDARAGLLLGVRTGFSSAVAGRPVLLERASMAGLDHAQYRGWWVACPAVPRAGRKDRQGGCPR
jgi:hypothetical protein